MLELLTNNHAKSEPETVHANAGKPEKMIVYHMRTCMKIQG